MGCKNGQQNALKHGGIHTRLYRIWNCMKQRILNPNDKDYPNYGGRGITICDEWLEFIPFRDWSLANGYADDLVIDRKENDLGYSPENCRWVTILESNRNRRFNKLTKETASKIIKESINTKLTRKQLAQKYNIGLRTLYHVLANETWGD